MLLGVEVSVADTRAYTAHGMPQSPFPVPRGQVGSRSLRNCSSHWALKMPGMTNTCAGIEETRIKELDLHWFDVHLTRLPLVRSLVSQMVPCAPRQE